jgi:hypothetical protein
VLAVVSSVPSYSSKLLRLVGLIKKILRTFTTTHDDASRNTISFFSVFDSFLNESAFIITQPLKIAKLREPYVILEAKSVVAECHPLSSTRCNQNGK